MRRPIREADDKAPLMLYLLRRIVFAAGVGLLLVGVGIAMTSPSSDAPYFMGWGGGLMALCISLGKIQLGSGG